MKWQSMFGAGACTVSCRIKNPTQDQVLWSGTLAKGAASPVFPGLNSSGVPFGQLQINVDANGVTSLSSPDNSWTSAAMYALAVAPQYDVSQDQVQAGSASVPGLGAGNTAQVSNDGNVEGGTTCTIAAGGSMTPSTVTFAPRASASLAIWANPG